MRKKKGKDCYATLNHEYTHLIHCIHCSYLHRSTSTGDALLVDFAQVSHASLVRARPGALSIHR